jgi:hypothetical protein
LLFFASNFGDGNTHESEEEHSFTSPEGKIITVQTNLVRMNRTAFENQKKVYQYRHKQQPVSDVISKRSLLS